MAAGLAVAQATGSSDLYTAAALACAAGVAALVPDWLQVNMPGLNKTIKGAFGHRGFSHWLLTAGAVYLAVSRLQPAVTGIPLAVAAGWLSHILLDALNAPGIPAFWPLPNRLHLASFKTGATVDRAITWLAVALGVWQVKRVTRSDTPTDTPIKRAVKPARSPDLSIEEKVYRAALSLGTMSVAVMWNEFRDRDDVDITQRDLKSVLSSLEGTTWTTPQGETYRVVSKPKHKGRRLVRT